MRGTRYPSRSRRCPPPRPRDQLSLLLSKATAAEVEEKIVNARVTRFERWFEMPMLFAALLVVPVIVIEEADVAPAWKTAGTIMNWIIWGAFAAELVVMLAVVPSRRAWLRQHPLEVVIVLLTPPFLPASLQAIRVLRLLRLLRLVRLVLTVRRLFSLDGLRYAALLALTTALAGGAAFAAVEKNATTWDGVWWAVTTMTTVGYGDHYPVTVAGRVIGIVLMLVGIGFVAVLTGAVAERFLAQQVEDVAEAQAEATVEIEASELEVLTELRAVRERLNALELRLAGRSAE